MAFNLEWKTLPPGYYTGEVSDAKIHYGEVAALLISYTIEHGGEFYGLSEYLPIDAPSSHARYAETAKGKARVLALLGPNPRIESLDDLANQLLGIPMKVAVGSRVQDGLPVPKVNSVGRLQNPENLKEED